MSAELAEMVRSVMKEELQPIKEELQDLNRRVDSIESHIEKIETNVGKLEIRVGTMEKDLSALKEITASTETKLQVVYDQTAKLTEYDEETMARFQQFATIEKLAYIDVKISEHDREIFKMKHRA